MVGSNFPDVSPNTAFMTSNVNIKSNGPAPKAAKSAPAPGTPQSPSVPISLYREVASELQTTQLTLKSLKVQNQELTQKNQQLRLEIERVVQSALHLRQLADPSWGTPDLPAEWMEHPQESQALSLSPEAGETVGEVQFIPTPQPPMPENLRTEQGVQPQAQSESSSTTEMSTWWLIMIVCMIVLTAFGTGFLIVRPLLPSR